MNKPTTGQSVYVDRARWPFRGMVMCHMFADRVEDLHLMAESIGIKRRWFQNKRGFPHYDICKTKRAQAVKNGAIEVTDREFVEIVSRARGVITGNGDAR